MPTAPASPFVPAPLTRKATLQTLAIGFAAGLVNGLIGIGGGLLIVPGLLLVRMVPAPAAVATSLATVMILSGTALGFHLWWSGMHMDPLGTVVLLLAGMVAAQAGAWLLRRISTRGLLFAFTGITFFSSVHLLAVAAHWMHPLMPGIAAPPFWSYPALGAMSGFLSGLLGIGGGGLVVLGFSVIFNTPILGDLPIALAVNVANGASAVIAQWRSGRILWKEVGYLIPTALVGIVAGTALAIWLPPNALRMVFALFFLYMSFRLFRRALRGTPPAAATIPDAPQK